MGCGSSNHVSNKRNIVSSIGDTINQAKHKLNQKLFELKDNNTTNNQSLITENEEYEMKFIVLPEYYNYIKTHAHSHTSRVQGYINILSKNFSQIRIAKRGDREYGLITFKTKRKEAHRTEFQYRIPAKDAEDIIYKCDSIIRKTRYFITDPKTKLEYEVDFFEDKNAGLVMAEIEFVDYNAYYRYKNNMSEFKPKWLGQNVTDDERYYNDNLARYPYSEWS